MQKTIAKKLTLLLTLLAILAGSHAQNRTISGTVTDLKGVGIPSVTVTVKGTRNAAVTDGNGSFSITAPENAALVFSSVGYVTVEVPVQGRSTINTSLTAQESNLSEVVVIGYGTARRRDLTGSVSAIRAKDFNKGVQVSPDQLIQGKAAGVMVINNSGQPGGATTVRIRGTSSIRSGNQPLFVVDGVALSGGSARPGGGGAGIGTSPGGNPLNFINPNDIASIEVLKDASATAIYGSRGANGVVIITTKKGQSGALVLEASASGGVSSLLKRLEVLNADEYRNALSKYSLTSGDYGGNVDAFDAITRKGIVQNYTTALSGGNENGRYRISLGFLNQEGIIRESGIKKVTAGLTSNFRLLHNRKLGIDFNIITANNSENIAPISNDAGFTGSLIGQALQWNPTHPLRKPNDSIWINNQLGATTVNPLAMLAAHEDRASTSTIVASISPSFRFTNDLEYRFLYGINYETGVRRNQLQRFINITDIQNRGIASVFNNQGFNQTLTNTLSYNRQITSAFNLNAVIGHEFLRFDNKGSGITARDFGDFGLDYDNYLQYSTISSRDIFSFINATTELQSFFGRAIINYVDKYLLTATMRADGSTRFGANNKYGYFPSVAFAWIINNEDFLKGNDVVNSLKLRLGWGRTGNQEFPSGASLNRFVFPADITRSQSVSRSNFGNEDLKWETSTQSNAGIDFSLFRERVFGSLDYFYKKTTDVLFEQTVAAPGPTGRVWINLPGYILNKGVEASINGGILRSKDINWNVGVNATFLQNEVKGLIGFYETGQLHGQGISSALSQRIISAQPLNVYYLAIYEGIDKSTGQATYTNGEPSINKFYTGSPNPKMLLGISTDFSYKKLTATINMNGVFGHYLYNNTANTVLPIGNLGTRNVAKSIINNDVQESISNPITPSTRFLEKGNYLKMANATLSYSLGNIGSYFRNATISLTGQNLFILTNYTGFDPEVNTDKQVGGVPSLGIEYTPYPTARTIILSINFSL